MSGLGGTPFDELFEALTQAMGIPHTVGSAPSQRQRVVWERSGALDIVPGFHAPGRKRIGRLAHPWTATVYGDSDLQVCELLAQLLGHLERLAGPKGGAVAIGTPGAAGYVPERLGYAVKPGKVEPRGGDGKAAGYACDVAVTLHTPIDSEIRPPATVAAVSLNVSATTDTGAEIGAANP